MSQKYTQSGSFEMYGTGSIRIYLHYPFKTAPILWAVSEDPDVKTNVMYENERHFLINYAGPERRYRIKWVASGLLD